MALLTGPAGIELMHVPYKGAGAAVAAVVANQSQILFTATGAAMPQIKNGRVRAIGVTSCEARARSAGCADRRRIGVAWIRRGRVVRDARARKRQSR